MKRLILVSITLIIVLTWAVSAHVGEARPRDWSTPARLWSNYPTPRPNRLTLTPPMCPESYPEGGIIMCTRWTGRYWECYGCGYVPTIPPPFPAPTVQP